MILELSDDASEYGRQALRAFEAAGGDLLLQRAEGLATLLISEDLDEVKALSDRIIVLFGGEIMGELAHDEATAEKLGLLMAGERQAVPA